MKKDNKEVNTKSIRSDIDKSCNRIMTYKLAIRGLLGNVSEYVVDKLIEIAKDINNEETNIKFNENLIKKYEE